MEKGKLAMERGKSANIKPGYPKGIPSGQALAPAASELQLGKIPPQATDLEEAVLGALMLEKDALTNVIDILKPESFY